MSSTSLTLNELIQKYPQIQLDPGAAAYETAAKLYNKEYAATPSTILFQ